MTERRIDAQVVQGLAEAAGLVVDQATVERLAPQLASLLAQAERLHGLDLDELEPPGVLRLEAR